MNPRTNIVATWLMVAVPASGQSLGGYMHHVSVGYSPSTSSLFIVLDPIPPGDRADGVKDMIGPGSFATPPYNVLNGSGYNAQHGWVIFSPFFPPAGSDVLVRVVWMSPGLRVYEGGFATDGGAGGFPQPMTPIFGTASSPAWWSWPGSMVHNWYAADLPGLYSVTHEVYFGDPLTGAPTPGYGSATVTFHFEYAPANQAPTLDLLSELLNGELVVRAGLPHPLLLNVADADGGLIRLEAREGPPAGGVVLLPPDSTGPAGLRTLPIVGERAGERCVVQIRAVDGQELASELLLVPVAVTARADANRDGRVDASDQLGLLASYGVQDGSVYDQDADLDVDALDLARLLASLGFALP